MASRSSLLIARDSALLPNPVPKVVSNESDFAVGQFDVRNQSLPGKPNRSRRCHAKDVGRFGSREKLLHVVRHVGQFSPLDERHNRRKDALETYGEEWW